MWSHLFLFFFEPPARSSIRYERSDQLCKRRRCEHFQISPHDTHPYIAHPYVAHPYVVHLYIVRLRPRVCAVCSSAWPESDPFWRALRDQQRWFRLRSGVRPGPGSTIPAGVGVQRRKRTRNSSQTPGDGWDPHGWRVRGQHQYVPRPKETCRGWLGQWGLSGGVGERHLLGKRHEPNQYPGTPFQLERLLHRQRFPNQQLHHTLPVDACRDCCSRWLPRLLASTRRHHGTETLADRRSSGCALRSRQLRCAATGRGLLA